MSILTKCKTFSVLPEKQPRLQMTLHLQICYRHHQLPLVEAMETAPLQRHLEASRETVIFFKVIVQKLVKIKENLNLFPNEKEIYENKLKTIQPPIDITRQYRPRPPVPIPGPRWYFNLTTSPDHEPAA